MPDERNMGTEAAGTEPADGVEKSGITRLAVTSFLWAFAGFAGNRVVALATTLILARILAPEAFGAVAAGLVLLGFTNVLLDLGLSAAIVQQQERGYGRMVDTAFTTQLGLAILATGSLIAVAPLLASAVGVDDVLVLQALSLSVFIRSLGLTHEALMRRDLLFRPRTVVEIGKASTRLAASVALAVGGAGVWALVAGVLISEATAVIARWLIVPYRPRLRITRADLTILVRFGGTVTLLRILSAVMADADYIVIGNRLGAAALGLYVIAYRLPELLIQSVLNVFSQVAFPVLSRARSRTVEEVRSAVLKSLKLVTLFGFTTGAGLALVATDAIDLLFGAKWEDSAEPMAILAVGSGISAIGYGVGDLYLAMGRPATRLWIVGGLIGPMIIALILAAPHGIVAVAYVHLGTALTVSVVELFFARGIIGLKWRQLFASLRAPVLATIAIVLATRPVFELVPPGPARLAVTVVVGGVAATSTALIVDRSLVALLADVFASMRERRS